MTIPFYKYQGAGNDFIILDNRNHPFQNIFDKNRIARLCDRRFGIGADGFMLLENADGFDFAMKYYNSDGAESTMCGNGGRCLVAFAKRINAIAGLTTKFIAIDGEHSAWIDENDLETIKLQMIDVKDVETDGHYFYLNTGSPHYVVFVNNLKDLAVYDEGRKIRYNDRFQEKGTNVNFVEIFQDHLFVRTYERGVENETYACGTGVVASSIAAFLFKKFKFSSFKIKTLGGELATSFEYANQIFTKVCLQGSGKFVFEGKIELDYIDSLNIIQSIH